MRRQALSRKRNAAQHSLSCCSPASGACVPSDTVEAIGSSYLVAKGALLNVIHEALQHLSDMLSSDFDASELKDRDCELLQLVIDNLGAFTIKNRKAVEKIFQDNFCNNEESSPAKKLWIDAEAALCSFKFELQLSQMKLEAEDHNHRSKGELQESSEVSSLKSTHDHDEYEAPVIAEENNPLAALPASKDKVSMMELDDSVLKDSNTANSTWTLQQSSPFS